MKKIIAFALLLVCVFGLVACDQTNNSNQQDDMCFFYAKVLDVEENYLLVQPSDDSNERKSSDKIEVSLGNNDASFPKVEINDFVKICYDGMIQETYPARITGTYQIDVFKFSSTDNEMDGTTDPTSGGILPEEVFDTTVSYANWTSDLDGFYSKILNADKMSISSVRHLPIVKFDTLEDLNNFKTEFADVFSMDNGYNEISSFNEVTAEYDQAFFNEKTMLLVYIEASSGSDRFGLDSVYCDGSSFCMHVKQIDKPDVGTDDMAGWFITVAVQDSMIANCVEFDADFVWSTMD